MINICVPTLNRYDKLNLLLDSLSNGSVLPDNIHILDNGGNLELSSTYKFNIHIVKPGYNMGVAASWNWFIKNVGEIRVICNDDIIFEKDALENFVKNSHKELISSPDHLSLNVFSCFIFPDKMVELVGYFDENISPNYAYFEDNDYAYRLKLAGLCLYLVPNVKVIHDTSATLKKFSSHEKSEHHRKFESARKNYIKKWGGTPGNERFITPYNGA